MRVSSTGVSIFPSDRDTIRIHYKRKREEKIAETTILFACKKKKEEEKKRQAVQFNFHANTCSPY